MTSFLRSVRSLAPTDSVSVSTALSSVRDGLGELGKLDGPARVP
ncbi:hypothetical protein HSB1_04150 [Halogranum salarium B-1]|uniref:Uncharacterized protein n=1 Tax=Halogranum salarium B-1 TaxID=1210908 RepID=J3JHX3_9EURY|nr:hypothetical protein HSB1_04150 [Halogranum salarium B-1]